jgi:DNA-binding transcriptional LysR family regulator
LDRFLNQYPKIINIFFKNMKINRLQDLSVFVSAAQFGNFSDAARDLGISPVVASAIIKRLEASLGVRLFERSTRRVRLSEAGERLLPHAREALQALAFGEAALSKTSVDETRLHGPLRLSMPSDLGRSLLIDWIEEFIASQGPGAPLMLELRVSDRLSNLLQQPVDFALRYGKPEDSGMIALPVAPHNQRILAAAPAYLARHGTPSSPQDLRQHNCLRFVIADTVHGRWRFNANGEETIVDVQGDRIADDGGIVRQWALAGLGICNKSYLDVAHDLASGRLVRLLPDWQGEITPLTMLVVSRQHLNGGIRALCADLAARCQQLEVQAGAAEPA